MRTYRQLTSGERYALSALRKQGCSQAQIARTLNRHPSTISREIHRNSKDRTGRVYRPTLADDYARWRRSRPRRNQRFTPEYWAVVVAHLKKEWSPEQISGWLRRKRRLSISHETIYRYIFLHDQLVQCQVRHCSLQAPVLALELLQAPCPWLTFIPPYSRLISFTDLPRARPTSASRSAVMICSGVCRFLPFLTSSLKSFTPGRS